MAALRFAAAIILLAWALPAAADPVDRWAVHVAEASARFGVPSEWIRRVIRVESGGRALIGGRPAVSRAGAMGLMQLMPATWRETRARLGLGFDPHDPRDNILAGTSYLRAMYDRFGYPGLFGAYNAGPARYSAYLTNGRGLPLETRLYLAALAGPPAHLERRLGRTPAAMLFALAPATRAPRAVSPPAQPALFVPLGNASGR